jgi:type II secretory pathway pseudopilin PulG
MLVATVIMGIAVVGLLSNLSTSLRNAARLTDYDRAALIGRRTMDELLLDARLPVGGILEGRLTPDKTGVEGGWRARLTAFEQTPNPVPGEGRLERLELEVWWMSGGRRRSFSLEGYRRGIVPTARASVEAGQP